jgi:TrmH RNA methyltransferase
MIKNRGTKNRGTTPGSKPALKLDLVKIGGLPAVQALFARAPDRAVRLFFEPRLQDAAAPFCKVMAAARKVFRMVPAEELAKIAGTPLHGGILVVAQPRPLPAFEPRMAAEWARDGQPLLILDGVGNPHNLGAIARTLAFYGLPRLVISGHPGQAAPSDAAWRVSEGGLEWLELVRAAPLVPALAALKPHYRLVATALGAGRALAEVLTPGPKPLAVILGNEEVGVPPETLAACDELATIPGSGRVQSLNVAATAAILVDRLAGTR